MDLTPLLIMAVGISLGFFAQTITGFGAALVSLPILLLILSLPDAMSLMSIFLLLFSLILAYQNRTLINKKVVLQMAIGGTLGMILGVQTLKWGNPVILKKALGIFIVGYVLHAILSKREIQSFKKLGFLFSILGGFFSGLFSSGGPLFITYIHNKLKDIKVVRATLIGTLAITNTLRIPLLTQAGLMNKAILMNAAYLLPFFLLAIFLGSKFFHHLNEHLLKRFFLFVLLASGIALIIK